MIRNRNAPRGPEVDRADAAKWVEALEKELANPTATAYSLRQHARDGAAKVWLCLPKEEEDAARARLRDLANQLHERAGELENDDRRAEADRIPALVLKARAGDIFSSVERDVLATHVSLRTGSVNTFSDEGRQKEKVYLNVLLASVSEYPHRDTVFAACKAAMDGGNQALSRALNSLGGRVKHRVTNPVQARAELRAMLQRYAEWFGAVAK
jgi:hypothetical protein